MTGNADVKQVSWSGGTDKRAMTHLFSAGQRGADHLFGGEQSDRVTYDGHENPQPAYLGQGVRM